jgi:hypothetical protein
VSSKVAPNNIVKWLGIVIVTNRVINVSGKLLTRIIRIVIASSKVAPNNIVKWLGIVIVTNVVANVSRDLPICVA